GFLAAALLTAVLPRLSAPPPAVAQARASPARGPPPGRAGGGRARRRARPQLGFTPFMPFYWKDVLHGDPRLVGTLLAVFLGAGAIGTLAVGPLDDWLGAPRLGGR